MKKGDSDFKCSKNGLVVCEECPFIGTSPDGMTDCFQTQGVIERADRILEQKLVTQLDASTLSTAWCDLLPCVICKCFNVFILHICNN